jgi:hypothetical protein
MINKSLLPIAMALSFLLTFALAIGYYSTKSIFLLSLSLYSFSFAFSLLMFFAQSTTLNMDEAYAKELEQSQRKTVMLNGALIAGLAVLIIVKASLSASTYSANFAIAFRYALSAFAVYAACAIILAFIMRKNSLCKVLFWRAVLAIFLIVLNFVLIKMEFQFADFIACLAAGAAILGEAVVLIIKTVKSKK